jgi:hypothetical protein
MAGMMQQFELSRQFMQGIMDQFPRPNMNQQPTANQIVESRPLFKGAFRLNIADENSFALSDHLPQLAVFGEAK